MSKSSTLGRDAPGRCSSVEKFEHCCTNAVNAGTRGETRNPFES
jgi:hypothetical protein